MTPCNCKQELPLNVLLFQRVGLKSDRVITEWGLVLGKGQHSDFIAPIYTQNCFSRVTADLHWIYHMQRPVYIHCRSILMLVSISVQGVFFFLDVNECSYVEFNACPDKNTCVNLEGYYSCDPQHEHSDVNPHQLSPGKKRRSHLGKYWEHFCRTLWSTAGATYKAKISGACSAPSPLVGRRCHINQVLAISDWNAVYIFHITWLFLLSHPQLSSLTCQTLWLQTLTASRNELLSVGTPPQPPGEIPSVTLFVHELTFPFWLRDCSRDSVVV